MTSVHEYLMQISPQYEYRSYSRLCCRVVLNTRAKIIYNTFLQKEVAILGISSLARRQLAIDWGSANVVMRRTK